VTPEAARTLVWGRRLRAIMAGALVVVTASYAVVLNLKTNQPLLGTGSTEVAALTVALVVVSGLGIVAALRPSGCNRLIGLAGESHQQRPDPEMPPGCTARKVVGHHSDCTAFSSHLIQIAGKPRCAGCTGMVAGGVAGILIGIALGAGLFSSSRDADAMAAVIGAAVSVAGFAGSYRKNATPRERVLASFALVAGAVTVASILSAFGAPQGVFGLCTAVAVVGLRIDVSRLLHLAVCLECGSAAATTSAA